MREQSPADPDAIMKDAFAAEPHDVTFGAINKYGAMPSL